MIIDCDRCDVRGTACANCVIGVLIDTHEDDRPVPYLPVDVASPAASPLPGRAEPLELAEPERRALEILADQGLIPRLRLVPRAEILVPERYDGTADDIDDASSYDAPYDDTDYTDDADDASDEPGGTERTRRAG